MSNVMGLQMGLGSCMYFLFYALELETSLRFWYMCMCIGTYYFISISLPKCEK